MEQVWKVHDIETRSNRKWGKSAENQLFRLLLERLSAIVTRPPAVMSPTCAAAPSLV
jgi:hypothetical protein